MLDVSQWSLTLSIGVFLVSALTIGIFGTKLTQYADRLADMTGLGEAMTGAVLLGGSTSLAGIVTSVTAAANGYAELAVSNAIGGIAAQTAFLAIADMAYRKINLEHAAASAENLMYGTLLVILLSLPILAVTTAPFDVFNIHPISLILILVYIWGLRLINTARSEPMWRPRHTKETRVDIPKFRQEGARQQIVFWLLFLGCAMMVGLAGYFVAKTGTVITSKTQLSQTLVGAVFTAIATSLPELVTSVAAVRQGALTLAVGGIIGGNCFDVLFVAFSDFAYAEGSIYAQLTNQQLFIIALTILLTGMLLLGMLRREKHGIVNIGFESFFILILYIAGGIMLFVMG